MSIFDQPSFESDSFQVGAASESQFGLYLHDSNKMQIETPVKQAVCSLEPVPVASVDDVAIWFEKTQVPDPWNGQVVLHQKTIQGWLQEPCLPVETRANLEFLDDHFQMLATPEKDKYQDRITSESMDVFNSWVVANQAELRILEITAPDHSEAISFLHDNFTLLDSNQDSKLTREEMDSAKRSGNFDASQMLGLSQLDRNFNDLVERPPRSKGESLMKLISDLTGGPLGSITPKSIAQFMVRRNDDSSSSRKLAFVDGIAGIEMLRFNQEPGYGMINHPSPYIRDIRNRKVQP